MGPPLAVTGPQPAFGPNFPVKAPTPIQKTITKDAKVTVDFKNMPTGVITKKEGTANTVDITRGPSVAG